MSRVHWVMFTGDRLVRCALILERKVQCALFLERKAARMGTSRKKLQLAGLYLHQVSVPWVQQMQVLLGQLWMSPRKEFVAADAWRTTLVVRAVRRWTAMTRDVWTDSQQQQGWKQHQRFASIAWRAFHWWWWFSHPCQHEVVTQLGDHPNLERAGRKKKRTGKGLQKSRRKWRRNEGDEPQIFVVSELDSCKRKWKPFPTSEWVWCHGRRIPRVALVDCVMSLQIRLCDCDRLRTCLVPKPFWGGPSFKTALSGLELVNAPNSNTQRELTWEVGTVCRWNTWDVAVRCSTMTINWACLWSNVCCSLQWLQQESEHINITQERASWMRTGRKMTVGHSKLLCVCSEQLPADQSARCRVCKAALQNTHKKNNFLSNATPSVAVRANQSKLRIRDSSTNGWQRKFIQLCFDSAPGHSLTFGCCDSLRTFWQLAENCCKLPLAVADRIVLSMRTWMSDQHFQCEFSKHANNLCAPGQLSDMSLRLSEDVLTTC